MDTLTREVARIVRKEVDAAVAELRRELLVSIKPSPPAVERVIERTVHVAPAHVPNADPPSKYLGTQAAAEYLGLSPKWLYNLRYAGKGPVARKHGRLVKYLREDLDAWMEEQVV
jgi:excisionase family DNA binding protein